MTRTVLSWLTVASLLCPVAEAGFPSRKGITGFRRVLDGRTPSSLRDNSDEENSSEVSSSFNSLYRQSRSGPLKHNLDSFSSDSVSQSTTQYSPVVTFNVFSHLDTFPNIVEQENVHNGNENSDSSDDVRTYQGKQNLHKDGDDDDDGDVPASDDFDDDDDGDMNEEGCTAMAMKKHNAVGDDPSDNDASDSDEDDEDEFSMEFSDAELEELAGEALSHAAAAAQSFLNSRSMKSSNVDKDSSEDDNRIGDVRTGQLGDDQLSEEDEDDIDQVNIDMDIVLSSERDDSVPGSDGITERLDDKATSYEDADSDYSTMNVDDLLLTAIQAQVFFPPTTEQIMDIAQQQKSDDSFSKKNGLDRRTFYRSLLLELMGEIDADLQNLEGSTKKRQITKKSGSSKNKKSSTKTSKRKFLDEQTVARQLRSTLSLATQPKWRRHMMRIAHRHVHGTDLVVPEGSSLGTGSGLKLYADDDGGSSSLHTNKQNTIVASCSMQETLLLALAHSLQCGMITLDDNFFISVRKHMAATARLPGVHVSREEIAEIKNGDILDALFAFSNSGALRDNRFKGIIDEKLRDIASGAKLSTKMKGDFLAWEVVENEGSNKSLESQLEFEQKELNLTKSEIVDKKRVGEDEKVSLDDSESSMDAQTTLDEIQRRPLPLVVYLRADPSLAKDEMDSIESDSTQSTFLSSQKIFQSKSSMDRLLAELKYHNSIHLICLGKECDFDTVGELLRSDGKTEGQQQQGSSGMDLESKSGGSGGFGGMFGGGSGSFGGQNPFSGLSPGGQKPGSFPGMAPGTTNPFLQAMQNAFASAGYRTNNNRGNNNGNSNSGSNNVNPNPMQMQPSMMGPNHPMFNSGFGPNNNASGANDPEGSQRFNIFLARTVDDTGNPGIMGAVAPPAAGNVFPLMFSMMQQRQRQQQQQQQGNSSSGGNDGDSKNSANNSNSFQIPPMPPWGVPHSSSTWQTNPLPGMQIPTGAQFFNASIHISGMTMNRNDDINGGDEDSATNNNNEQGSGSKDKNINNNSWGKNAPPPELLQKAMEMAMTQVVERLADANTGANNNNNNPHIQNIQGNLPPQLAKAFSTILANEQLRRGIAENLARAAPALLDPRCQGVMLSVYVPPGPDHPNRGQMPGGVANGGMNSGTITASASVNPSSTQGATSPSTSSGDVQGSNSSHSSKGSWFQKILSSPVISSESTSTTENKEDNDVIPAEAENTVDESKREKLERKAAKRLLNFKSRSKKNKDDDIDGKDSTSTTSDIEEGQDDVDIEEEKDSSASTKVSSLSSSSSSSDDEKSKKKQAVRSAQTAIVKRSRNIRNLEALCHTSVPLMTPSDPIKKKLWNGWLTRQCNARCFRKNRSKLEELLLASGLYVTTKNNMDSSDDSSSNDHDGDDGDEPGQTTLRPLHRVSPTLQAMLSVKDCTEDMTEVIRVAVEIEAERTLRNVERPGGVQSMDDEPIDDDEYNEENDSFDTSTPMHSSSIESALALVCRVTPHASGSADGSSGGAYGVSSSSTPKRSREELMQAASDKHERALCQNIIFPEHIGVTYDQIGGLDEVKELLRQSITYPLKYPSLYSEGIARESCKGVLLFGPPGTGKTMLAKAVATEGGATFLSVDASSVENKWLGESEKNAKAVFTLARRLAPCVIFLDEVDSLLSSREGTGDDSAHGTLTSVKTTMMSEWDGLNSGTNGEHAPRVIVIGSTNRPFDLDEAVLRRFPRRILVDLPDLDTRREILEVTMAENRVEPSVNFTSIAERLEGYTGSDIKEVCREAVVRISHEQAKMLDRGFWSSSADDKSNNESSSGSGGATLTGLQRLRPVKVEDFEVAMSKLKRSVSEKGRELARVWEWNDEYGEIKRKDRSDSLPQLMNMFL